MQLNTMAEVSSLKDICATLEKNSFVCIQMKGKSMRPSMYPGSIAMVRKFQPDELRPGCIAVVKRSKGYVVHRFISVRDNLFIFRGDSLKYSDPPVAYDQILALVDHVIVQGRIIEINSEKNLKKGRRIATFGWFYRMIWRVLYPLRQFSD